jgi:hypothetical protein
VKKFEQLHIEDQVRLVLEAMRMISAGKCGTIERFARENDFTPAEFWREVCAAEGFDECEPWAGFPAGPTHGSWNYDAGGARELPPHYQKLLEQMRAITGKNKH